MDFNNMKIINTSKVKYPDRKLMVECYLTSEPLFKESEIIALLEAAKDKRTYSTLTIVLEPKANELTTWDSLIEGVFKVMDRGEFTPLGDNKSLLYLTLEPTASILNRIKKKQPKEA